MSPADLDFLCALVRVRSGLVLSGERSFYAETRLSPLARREGLASVADLVAVVRDGRDERLLRGMVEAMLVQETSFYRDRSVFRGLVSQTLPALAAARGGVLRVWSAGCGGGQEPYSLAMSAEEEGALAGVDIFASDLSSAAIEKAESGIYTHFEVQRGLPIRQLLRHFTPLEDGWRLSEAVRRRVRWGRLNLIDAFTTPEPFDVILCRHVLDVFEPNARSRVLAGLTRALASDGCLILGPQEAAPDGFLATGPGIFRRKLIAVAAA